MRYMLRHEISAGGGGPVVRFHTHFPTSGLETTFSKPFEMRLALQGKGIEADTEPLHLKIIWDGKWADETKEMAKHFVIEEITD